jgi:hypothetical protein
MSAEIGKPEADQTYIPDTPPGPGEKPGSERSAYARWMDAAPPRHEADRQWFAVFDARGPGDLTVPDPRNGISQAGMEAGT